jgi:energy-coupling factor transport system permease protein
MTLARSLAAAGPRAAWARVDPRLKLAALAWVSLLAVLLDAPAPLAALAVLAAVGAAGIRLTGHGWLVLVGLLALVVWGTLASQALFYADVPRTPLATLLPAWELGDVSVPALRLYREGVTYGLVQSLRLAAMTLAGLAVCLTTSPERLLAALSRVGLPAALAFVVQAALRCLPTVLSEWSLVRQARRLRTVGRAARRPRWLGLRGELAVLVPVLSAALRRSTALATSAAARGFDPAARRTSYPPLVFRWWERCALAALATSAVVLLAVKVLYWLYLNQWHYAPQLRGLYAFARQWL